MKETIKLGSKSVVTTIYLNWKRTKLRRGRILISHDPGSFSSGNKQFSRLRILFHILDSFEDTFVTIFSIS